jgi:hypothetical protein
VFKDPRKRTYPEKEYKFNEFGKYQVGVDLAKSNDYTVITPFDLTTFRVCPQDSFNQIDYTLQKTKIEAAFLRHNKALVVVDNTGVGVPIVDDLVNKGINVAPYRFTFNSRNELLVNLQILLEQDRIKIPDNEELLEQLEAAVWDISENGRSRIVVPEPMHDDRLMSLALAVWNIPTRPITVKSLYQKLSERGSGGVKPFYPEWSL